MLVNISIVIVMIDHTKPWFLDDSIQSLTIVENPETVLFGD